MPYPNPTPGPLSKDKTEKSFPSIRRRLRWPYLLQIKIESRLKYTHFDSYVLRVEQYI